MMQWSEYSSSGPNNPNKALSIIVFIPKTLAELELELKEAEKVEDYRKCAIIFEVIQELKNK